MVKGIARSQGIIFYVDLIDFLATNNFKFKT